MSSAVVFEVLPLLDEEFEELTPPTEPVFPIFGDDLCWFDVGEEGAVMVLSKTQKN